MVFFFLLTLLYNLRVLRILIILILLTDVVFSVPKLRVELKMPSHYPSYYDYLDEEIINRFSPSPTQVPDESFNTTIILIGALCFLILAVVIVLILWGK